MQKLIILAIVVLTLSQPTVSWSAGPYAPEDIEPDYKNDDCGDRDSICKVPIKPYCAAYADIKAHDLFGKGSCDEMVKSYLNETASYIKCIQDEAKEIEDKWVNKK